MKLKKGFTIIELLIVMAVIAILVGIAIPSFRAMQTEAWRTKAEGDVRVIKIALESYYKNQGSFPPVAAWQSDLISASPRVLETELKDPFNPTDNYVYDLSPDFSYYVVYSVGPDNGSVTITNTGSAAATDNPIYVTNGY